MKPSHERAPRTLAECQWVSGYSSIQVPTGDRIAGRLLAVFIGAAVLT